MQRIEAEGRNATPEEQARLALFTGFGASDLANALFRRAGEAFRPGWEDLGNELEQLVSPEEMRTLARSTQYAHYTPEFMVRAIWRAVERLGFQGGTVLEPGCGTGLFLAMMPERLAGRTTVTAVEMDPTTGEHATSWQADALGLGSGLTERGSASDEAEVAGEAGSRARDRRSHQRDRARLHRA